MEECDICLSKIKKKQEKTLFNRETKIFFKSDYK